MGPRLLPSTVLASIVVLAVAGCTTHVDGKASKTPHDIAPDGADLAVLDPGNYPRFPLPPMGPVNSDNGGTLLEGHRMANNVVGPWDIDPTLHAPVAGNIVTMQRQHGISADLTDPAQDIVSAHHLLAGFSTGRRSDDNKKSLIILVLRFPDPGSAGDVGKQLADLPIADIAVRPFAIPRYPDAIGRTYDAPEGGGHVTEGYLPHGPYLLYAWAQTPDSPDASAAVLAATFDQQIPKIDAFTPTDPAAIATLPLDPVGFLNRVVPAEKDTPGDVNFGGFQPYAALHLQDNPVQTAKDFDTAGVDAVGVLRTTVYRARDRAGAQILLNSDVAWAGTKPGVKPAAGVPGLPFSKCFEFTEPDVSQTPRLGCFAKADRYEFEAWSEQEPDVHQQIASQYLMLTQ